MKKPPAKNVDILPPPLWLLVDDQPEQEIFPRIANLLDRLEVADGRAFFRTLKESAGVIHEHPLLRVAWSTGDEAEVTALLEGAGKALVQMDLFWDEEGKGSQYGLRLVDGLLERPEIAGNCVFLLKSRVEGAYADEFRRRRVSYLRILRSLVGGEAMERIQFLGANLDSAADAGDYEATRLCNLLLSLQEEAFVDLVRLGRLTAAECHGCIETLRTRRFYQAFRGNPVFEERYVEGFLLSYFDDRSVANVAGSPLALGPVQRAWTSQSRIRSVRKLFNSGAREATALELALLRFGKVAAGEAVLFALSGVNGYGDVERITSGIINQKWNPNKFDSLLVQDVKDIASALEEVDRVVEASAGAGGMPSTYEALRNRFEIPVLADCGVLEAAFNFIHLRAYLKTACPEAVFGLLAPAVNRLERILRTQRGMVVLPLEIDSLGPEVEGDGSGRLERFRIGRKVYVLFNRGQVMHNLVHAQRVFERLASSDPPAAVCAALRLDSQCPAALRELARMAGEEPDAFSRLVSAMGAEDGFVPVGLPYPGRIGSLFQSGGDSGEFRDFGFFLRDPEAAPRADRGYAVSLLELVIGGLHVLRYHIEAFARLMSWSSESRIECSDELRDCLRRLWLERGWDRLFVPDLGEGLYDPLEGAWGREANLLDALREQSEAARSVSDRWLTKLASHRLEAASRGPRASYKTFPPDWLRILGLNLPLDYAPELDAGSGEVIVSDMQRLGVISIVREYTGGDPFALHERLTELLAENGSDFTVKEPSDVFNWETDEAFLRDVETALDILGGKL